MQFVSKLCTFRTYFKLKVPSLQLVRSYGYGKVEKRHKWLFRMFKKTSEQEYKIKDSVPDAFNLIYRNTMHNYMLTAQIISTASFVLIGAIVVGYSPETDYFQADLSAWKKQPAPVDNEVLFYIIVLCSFALVLQYTLRKTPVRVYNNPQNERYAFVYYGALPFTRKRAICGLDQIKKMPSVEHSIIPWHDCRYDVHNNSGTILVDIFFKTPAELNIMLGYQKRYVPDEEE